MVMNGVFGQSQTTFMADLLNFYDGEFSPVTVESIKAAGLMKTQISHGLVY